MEIRKRFLEYFEKNNHLVLPSSSLIPEDDPSVLLTTAGMQQFKSYFLGIKKPPDKKIATVQKCFRTSDIDSVGYTSKHCTFFEMLGNFSFGDYFKKEAIEYALDFIVNTLKVPLEKLSVAVFRGDKEIPADLESVKYWKKSGISDDRIYRFGRKENFWGPAGETGPCGPCAEIHYDFGEEYGCGEDRCNPNCECERFVEIWNLVFVQYNFDGKNYHELPQKNIDTGMGLERISAVMEGDPSIFKTPLFKEIIKKIIEISNYDTGAKKIKNSKGVDIDFDKGVRIVADHARAIYFLISNGVIPSNEGRGYILRRIIRRAIRFGRQLGIKDYFLNHIGETVINQYSKIYKELGQKKNFSFELVDDEEKRFSKTLKEGSKVLMQNISRIKGEKGKYLNSKDAFRLYDTFGFPVELTKEILDENNLKLNINEFNRYFKDHIEMSKKKDSFDKKINRDLDLYRGISEKIKTEFAGYQKTRLKTVIEHIIKIDKNGDKKVVSSLHNGEKGEILLKETPFYGEKGGQIGDKGSIKKDDNLFNVKECVIPVEGIYIHRGILSKGNIKSGDQVNAEVDSYRRKDISRNHTATHLLHWALRNIFGNEIKQSGSFVGEDKFRFDYTIHKPPGKEDIMKAERMINEKIQNNDTVRCFETTREFAEELGAVALFDEKYGKFVRVVEIDNYSRELCGGIHVNRTGDIGIFKILSDSGIGANLRRIEAVTGMYSYNYLVEKERLLNDISVKMEAEENELKDAVGNMKKNIQKKEQELASLKIKIAKDKIIGESGYSSKSSNFKIINFNFSKYEPVSNMSIKSMGAVGDEIKDIFMGKDTFIIFGNIINNKPVIVLQATGDLVKKGIDCGIIAGEVSGKLKGSGGGKPGFAQLGGFSADSLNAAINLAKNMVLKIINRKK